MCSKNHISAAVGVARQNCSERGLSLAVGARADASNASVAGRICKELKRVTRRAVRRGVERTRDRLGSARNGRSGYHREILEIISARIHVTRIVCGHARRIEINAEASIIEDGIAADRIAGRAVRGAWIKGVTYKDPFSGVIVY